MPPRLAGQPTGALRSFDEERWEGSHKSERETSPRKRRMSKERPTRIPKSGRHRPR